MTVAAPVSTDALLAQVCHRLRNGERARVASALDAAFASSTITTPTRIAAFLAQVAHESGEFRFWEEIWGPTAAQLRYEPPGVKAAQLGNTHTGDGYRYRGRGPMQLTGRANYRTTGERLGLPLEAEPDLVSETGIGCLVAVDFWDSRRLSPLADLETRDGFKALTRRINGGSNGLVAREEYHAAARKALGLAVVT